MDVIQLHAAAESLQPRFRDQRLQGVSGPDAAPALRFGPPEEFALMLLAFATFVGQLTAPLFQGGRLRANLSAAEARYKRQAATYEQTVLTAFREVKAALVAYEKQRRRYREVRRQVETAEDAFRAQRDRYERGVGDLLARIDAERTLTDAQTRLAGVRRATLNARLALHRALGGPWTEAEPVDDPRLFQ